MMQVRANNSTVVAFLCDTRAVVNLQFVTRVRDTFANPATWQIIPAKVVIVYLAAQ